MGESGTAELALVGLVGLDSGGVTVGPGAEEVAADGEVCGSSGDRLLVEVALAGARLAVGLRGAASFHSRTCKGLPLGP